MISNGEVEFRVNHIGYGAKETKRAYLCQFGSGSYIGKTFDVVSDKNDIVYTGTITNTRDIGYTAFDAIYECDFSSVISDGDYSIKIDAIESDQFSINNPSAYKKVLNTMLDFYQAQRCGNAGALLHGPCHLNDANAAIDCSGGWHDAGDYIKFMITASFVTLEMLTTYDYLHSYNVEEGLIDERGTGGVPDILEEARIGLEWILKMTADVKNGKLYYQVSGSEDHNYWRIPETDDETGVVGNPRALHKGWGENLTGRTVACLAIASRVWKEYDAAFAQKCLERALEIWAIRKDYKDVQKSNPEDYYGEWTSLDDMLMGSIELYNATGDDAYLPLVEYYLNNNNGYYIGWGNIDFLGVAACFRAGIEVEAAQKKMLKILDHRKTRSEEQTFYRSSGLSWGTNASYPSEAQMGIMYSLLTGDDTYLEMAQAQRDYLLGVNNWNISFIAGVGHRYPENSHSQLNDLVELHRGAVVGGPALDSSWGKILSLPKSFNDPYKKYQGRAVYYDWKGDYYTNEVAIDYSAAALFVISYYYGVMKKETSIIFDNSDKEEQKSLPFVQNGRDFNFFLDGDMCDVIVTDLRGRILQELRLKKDGLKFSGQVSSSISAGVYILRVEVGGLQKQMSIYLP